MADPLTASEKQTAANYEGQPYSNFRFHYYHWMQDPADLEGKLTAAPTRPGGGKLPAEDWMVSLLGSGGHIISAL